MYYYFSAGFASAVKINGAFLGLLTNEVKFCDITQNDAFIEICSLDPLEPSVNFLLNENFLSSPPDGVTITDLKGGYLIKCDPKCKGKDFKMLNQAREKDYAISVFNDNTLKISIETPFDFFIDEFKVNATSSTVESFFLNGNQLLIVTLKAEKTYFAVYEIGKKINRSLFTCGDSYSLENGLFITEKRTDIAKHVVTTEYFFDGMLKVKNISTTVSKTFNLEKLPQPILPFAFLEELLLGGEVSGYLSESVIKNADKLAGYLGNFIGVFPPPVFRDDNEVGLIYKTACNRYIAEYFTFEFENGKIINIKKSAN